MERQTYFEYPTQIKYLNLKMVEENQGEDIRYCWLGGIGCYDFIICAHCGEEIDPNELYDGFERMKEEHPDWLKYIDSPIQIYRDWMDFSDYITD